MLDTDAKAQLITRDPEIMSGAPVFKGTRVPVKTLIDFLQGGHDLDEFLTEYPSVTREQVIGVLQLAKQLLITQVA